MLSRSWFNQVDTTYRSELRDLNETNFARFEAKLELLTAQFDAKLGALESRLNTRMSAFETRLIRWMFLFWIGQAVTTVGLVFGIVQLVGH